MGLEGLDGVVGIVHKAFEFVTQPLEGKLLGTGPDIVAIVKRGIDAAVGSIANKNMQKDILMHKKYSKEAYERQVKKEEVEKKFFKERIYLS